MEAPNGVRIIMGFDCVPTSCHRDDEYTFWIASDDNGELYIAPNDQWSELGLIDGICLYGTERLDFSEEQGLGISLRAGYVYAGRQRRRRWRPFVHRVVTWRR